jgi:hypothetical protein
MSERVETKQIRSFLNDEIKAILPYVDSRILMNKFEYLGEKKAKGFLDLEPEYFTNYLKRGEKLLPLNITQDMAGQVCQLLLYCEQGKIGEGDVYHLAKSEIKFFAPVKDSDKQLVASVESFRQFENSFSFKLLFIAIAEDGKDKIIATLNIILATV